ncbi:RHS repeat-associated core domain-containing protein [Lysobacter sp. Root667]|uniref:RHS repeat domain-containing protein n=1 Tax=Lysobacter sp. Root667 TaxID=1736581 RepID=UPI00190FD4BE|nr:RHS repeat-associated core domain-containing protein [Lysobacter sp. Root667]
MNYAYNGRGEQTRRYPTTASTAQTYASYDEAGHTVGVYDHAGNRIQEIVWLRDLPVGVIDTNKLHYVQADHLGTPRNVIDPVAEKSVWTWQLGNEAFGDSAPNQDPDNNGSVFVFDLRFPGQRYDSASGLDYNYFRDYEPGHGRYAQSDPIGLAGGASTYGYVGSAPHASIDPSGLAGCQVVLYFLFINIEQCSYPAWVPPNPRVGHPEKYEVEEALNCPRYGSDCEQLGLSIEVILLDLRFRRWDMQTKAGLRGGRFDPGHVERYMSQRKILADLIAAAKQRKCPYNPAADFEVTVGPRYPTPKF